MTDDGQDGLPIALTFTTVGGAALPVMVESFAVEETSDTGGAARIRFSMSFEVFERALADEAFNLFPHVLLGNGVSGFDSSRDVVVDARLRALVARGFAEQNVTEQLVDNELLLRAESWLALTVVQALDMPSELGDDAHASVGCETIWNRPGQLAAGAPSIATVAADTLRSLGYDVDAVDKNLFRTRVHSNGYSWVLLVHADEQQRTCTCWGVYPHLAAAEQRSALASFLMEANYELSVGSFEIDAEDGEIRFRTSVDVGDVAFDPRLFERLVAHNLRAMSHAFPMLAAFFG